MRTKIRSVREVTKAFDPCVTRAALWLPLRGASNPASIPTMTDTSDAARTSSSFTLNDSPTSTSVAHRPDDVISIRAVRG